MSESDARRLVNLSPRMFVRLSIDGDVGDWHLNDQMVVSSNEEFDEVFGAISDDLSSIEETRSALVFQRADASAEWLVVAVAHGDPPSIEDVRLADEHANYQTLSTDVTVVRVADSKEELVDE